MIGSIRLHELFAAVLTVVIGFTSGCEKRPPEHAQVKASAGRIVLPISGVDDGKVHFYTYKHSGKRINFFVRTDGSGALSASFDTCFTCYKFRKGYRDEGTDLVCNECSMRFPLAHEKWDTSRGCSPIHIKSIIEGNTLVIQASDLEKGAKLF